MIGTTEIILIVVVALLLFGGKKLPELMKGMGQGVRSFKKGLSEDEPQEEAKKDATDQPTDKSNESKA